MPFIWFICLGLLCAVVVLVWWAGIAKNPGGIDARVVSFVRQSEHSIAARISVFSTSSKKIVCKLQGQNATGSIVGVRLVEFLHEDTEQKGKARVVDTVLYTSSKAETAIVGDCIEV